MGLGATQSLTGLLEGTQEVSCSCARRPFPIPGGSSQAVLCASKLVSILSAAAPPRAGLHGGPLRSPPRGLETLDVGLVTLDVGLIWAWGSLPTLACVPTCPLLALGLACD